MVKYEEIQQHLKNKKYKWLVTGAAGFIGSNLVEKLLTLDQRVVALDNFSTGYKLNIEDAIHTAEGTINTSLNNFEIIEGDITDLEVCKKSCNGVDFVLHQAALGSVPRSIKDPLATNKANVEGFMNMLQTSKDLDNIRFIYASSSSVYGDHPDLPKIENKTGKLLSPYAVSKYVNELYAKVFVENYGYKTIGLRYFNIFGKRQDPKGAYAGVIPKWIVQMINSETININGDGETTRDFCYIDNVVQANILAALTTNTEALGQVYNIAYNDKTSLNELYGLIKDRLVTEIDDLKVPEPYYRDQRPGDIRDSHADIEKAREMLGYIPTHNISSGLDETVKWYINDQKR
jgi:UDP-N-acetylglucosamine/UDP-N-acetylgalactosamine 4-epimerase